MPANADILLTHADGASNRVALKLWRDAPTLPGGWSVEHVSPAAPRSAEDAANYQQQSPDAGLVYDTNAWNRGFGLGAAGIGVPDHRARYGYSDGVLAMFGELMPGYKQDEVDLLVRNGRFETGSISPWTGVNATISLSTNAARSGEHAASVTVDANNGYIRDIYQGDETPLRSVQVKLLAYVQRVSGSGTAAARVSDSAGSTTGTTTTGDGWSLVEVDHTIDASASSLEWDIVFGTSGDVWEVDDVAVIPVGGVSFPAPLQEFKDDAYIAAGRGIYKWDESNTYFECVHMHASAVVTDLTAHSDAGTTAALYAAYGTGTNYERSTDGSTWANPATNSGNARLAGQFVRVRNANGDFALMKTRSNFVAFATDPSDTVNWSSELQVGDTDRAINNLIPANDTVYIGREDGLLVYDNAINRFRDIEPEANLFASPDNFDVGIGRGGAVWAGGGDQAFWRITPAGQWPFHAWQDFSSLFSAPDFRGFGGRVAAVGQDRHNLWVALADNLANVSGGFPYTFPITFATGLSDLIRIIAIRERSEDGRTVFTPHTVTALRMSGAEQMGRFTTATESSLFIFGTSSNADVSGSDTDEPRVIRLVLPVNNENPRLNATRAIRKKGQIFLPWLDFNYPDVEKAALKLTLTSRNFSAGAKFWTAYYKLDDASDDDSSGWTLWGDDGVFDTSPSETKAAVLTGPLTFKRVRLRLDYETDSTTDDPPTVTGIVLHAAWNPLDYRQFRAVTRLADRRSLQMRRVPQVMLRSADRSNLDTLRQEAFCILTDPDGSTARVRLRYRESIVAMRMDPLRGVPSDKVSVIELDMTEVLTT